MIFETIEFKSPTNCRDFTSRMSTRMRSATSIQQNKIRVLVMGASGVGKTSIVHDFTEKKFIEGFDDSNLQEAGTIIVELMDVQVTLISTLRRLAIKTAQAYILVYSMDDPVSFEYIKNIKQEIVDMKGEGMPIVVVGNKADTSDKRVLQMSKTVATAADWNIPFTVMSLREGVNIGSVYRHLFCHKTLQKLVDLVSIIDASTITSNLRRLSMPADALQSTMSHIAISLCTSHEERSCVNTREDEINSAVIKQSSSKYSWSKFKKCIRGIKDRK